MTQKQMIEMLRLSFPDVLEKTLRVMLNEANDQFVDETRILRNSTSISTTADTTEYAFSEFAISGDNPLYIQRVILDGTELLRLPQHENQAWDTRESTLIVGNYQTTDNQVELSAVDSGLTLEVFAVYEDGGFGTDLTAEPAYPKAFHQAIFSRVAEKLHAAKGDLALARYYRAEYQDYRKRAKQYIGSKGTKGQYETEQTDFRGV